MQGALHTAQNLNVYYENVQIYTEAENIKIMHPPYTHHIDLIIINNLPYKLWLFFATVHFKINHRHHDIFPEYSSVPI